MQRVWDMNTVEVFFTDVEPRLKAALLQLGNESTIFERLMYKNSNQHRRALYFRRLCQVRRDLRLLRSACLSELVQSAASNLKSSQNEEPRQASSARAISKDVDKLRRRLFGAAKLLQQMAEPILRASSLIAGLLGQTFFMPFALTAFSCLARFRVLLQQVLHDVTLIYNLLSACELRKLASPLIFRDPRSLEKQDKQPVDKLPDHLECKWDGVKLVLSSTSSNMQELKTNLMPWFVDDCKSRTYSVLDSLMSDHKERADQNSSLPVNGGVVQNAVSMIKGNGIRSLVSASFENEMMTAPGQMEVEEGTDCCSVEENMQHPSGGTSASPDDLRTDIGTQNAPSNGFTSSNLESKKRVAYISVSMNPDPESVKLRESPPRKRERKDALFDMLLGLGGKEQDTLF